MTTKTLRCEACQRVVTVTINESRHTKGRRYSFTASTDDHDIQSAEYFGCADPSDIDVFVTRCRVRSNALMDDTATIEWPATDGISDFRRNPQRPE